VSRSMQADDASTTRLGAALQLTGEMFEAMEESTRVGLVLFAGEAYLLTPPTHDYRSMAYMLRGLTPATTSPWDSGSRMSAGVREAVVHLTEDEDLYGQRILVVLSDGAGEEDEQEVMDAVRAAVESGVIVHVVGVGMDPAGPRESLLRQVAQLGRGMYTHGEVSPALQGRFRAPPAEAVPVGASSRWANRDVTLWLAIMTLALLVADGLLEGRLPRFERPWVRRLS